MEAALLFYAYRDRDNKTTKIRVNVQQLTMPVTFIFGRKKRSCWSRRTCLEKLYIILNVIGIAVLVASAVALYLFFRAKYEGAAVDDEKTETGKQGLLQNIGKGLSAIGKGLSNIGKGILVIGTGLVGTMTDLVGKVTNLFGKTIGGFRDFVKETIKSVVERITNAIRTGLNMLNPFWWLRKFFGLFGKKT